MVRSEILRASSSATAAKMCEVSRLAEVISHLQAIRRCVDVLCFGNPRRKGAIVSRIKRRAAALMDKPAIWAQVEAVAAALAEKTVLSGAQV